MPAKYPAKLDNLAKMITVVVCAVIIIPFITIGETYFKTHSELLLIGPALVLAGIIATFLFRPTGYDISTDAIVIHRPVGDKKLPLTYITTVAPIQIADLGFGVRTFASGGFLGYFGKFWYRKLGHVNFYATDRSKLILIRTHKDKKYLLSPDNTAQFLQDLHTRLGIKK